MRIVIYESSSRGGCFDYAKEIFKNYSSHHEVEDCFLLLPYQSEKIDGKNIKNILLNDVYKIKFSIYKKGYFLLRTFINPFIFFFFLIKKQTSLVIFNDFEQLSAFLWVPFFKYFLKKHTFAIVLHDPDRDEYPPSKSFSKFSMKILMSLMHFGLYHETLPDKKYYKSSQTRYINVPHGIYRLGKRDLAFEESVNNLIGKNFNSISIIGNIRTEKNYHLAIESLVNFPFLKLIIAGNPANQEVDLTMYKNLAQKLSLNDRIIWIERFLTDNEMVSLIYLSDIILLNYARSFKSQSGILNIVAPFEKKVIVSKGESGLHEIVKKYNLGILIEPDNLNALIEGIKETQKSDLRQNWKNYLSFASWENHTEIILRAYKTLKGIK